jgi:hypothetical protein
MSNQKPTHYQATLVRGSTYYLGPENRFEHGKPRIVTAAEKRKLETNAVENRTIMSGDLKEVDQICKFKFVPVAAPATPKVSKAAELAAMQNDGGVDFEEETDEDDLDEDADEGEDDGEGDDLGDETPAPQPEKPAKAQVKAGRGRNR